MPAHKRVSNEQIIEAYRATGSVWKAGKRLGIVGQSVHERLVAMGHPMPGSNWTDEEYAELDALIAEQVPLAEVARRLARTYNAVAIKASRRGLASPMGRRDVKLPRGKGYDKATTKRRLGELRETALSFTQWCRTGGFNVESTARAMQKHFPEEWAAYVASSSAIPEAVCPYCETKFIPNSGKQRFCTRHCGDQARVDASYFGGKRRETIGLLEGICQLCNKHVTKGLSSHHVFGKENDPENDFLVALCTGCHQIITNLGGRNFVSTEEGLEALIIFAWMRKHGPQIAAVPGAGVRVSVSLEPVIVDEDGEESEWDMTAA